MPNRYRHWKQEQERRRLAALKGLGILETPREERFDVITRLLARDFDVPISMISLVDDKRVWFKSEVGLEGIEEVSREITFCSHAIEADHIMVVEDAMADQRFCDNPLVTGEMALRFYAGAVIRSSHREPLGAVCIIDHKPRQMTYRDRRQLIDFANHVSAQITLKQGRLRDSDD
ncbi:GAF domain-containing protein [Kushneria sp. Sum13]|uniref:GAF domain-containing protein n=1 Tax=Kushneria sp. Sum13 TaxID=3459196 RepID=UPI004046681D